MDREFEVGQYYDHHIYDYEKTRLNEDSVVEYEVMLRLLDKWVLNNWTLADVGAGFGHYATHLAKRGCRIYLVDVSQRLLDAASKNLVREAGEKQMLGAYHLSATSLCEIANESLDAILMLGPFYHLTSYQARKQAVAEAHRVLKDGGIILASAINRFQFYKNLANPIKFLKSKNIRIAPIFEKIKKYAKDGVLTKELFGPLGDAYLASASEFESLFVNSFCKHELVGLESFFANQQDCFLQKDSDEKQLWLDLVQSTGETPEGIHNSEHLVYIGKKSLNRLSK